MHKLHRGMHKLHRGMHKLHRGARRDSRGLQGMRGYAEAASLPTRMPRVPGSVDVLTATRSSLQHSKGAGR